jgi:tRNA(Ile)-lysidine synthetase-like protein
VAVDYELIEALRSEPERFVSVGATTAVACDEHGQLHAKRHQKIRPASQRFEEVLISGPGGSAQFAGCEVQWSITQSRSSRRPQMVAGREIFDADEVGNSIVLRHWQPGDRFQPIGMSKPVKLQDLFTNLKIPGEVRRKLVVAVSQSGQLFWVEKLRISERFKLSPSTIRRLIWKWKPL